MSIQLLMGLIHVKYKVLLVLVADNNKSNNNSAVACNLLFYKNESDSFDASKHFHAHTHTHTRRRNVYKKKYVWRNFKGQ